MQVWQIHRRIHASIINDNVGGARGVMVIVVGNGQGNTNSNPGPG